MPEVSWPLALVLGAALLLVVVLLFYLTRGGRLREFTLKMPKILTFSGKMDTRPPEEERAADRVLKWLKQKLEKLDGNYVVTETTQENARAAANLYTQLHGEVIGTCFFESPDYQDGDFARLVQAGAQFTRITTIDVCAPAVAKIVRRRFSELECTARLAVIPTGVQVSKIGGIFCRFPDKSYLAFVALNNAGDQGLNRGLVFSGPIAEELFRYYDTFAAKYQRS